jgi:hypothetical protein
LNGGVDLTRSFTAEQFARALESWDWAGVQGKRPLFTSPFGDVFFQAQDGFWFLDLLEGTLTRPWPGADELRTELDTAEGQDRYLMAGLAFGAERQGIIPSARQVLSFKVAPILGGAIAVENIEVFDFEVIVHITGQLHRQVRDMPPGARITGFTFAPEPPQSQPGPG